MNDIYDYPEINSILGNDFWDGINNQLKEIARENGGVCPGLDSIDIINESSTNENN